MIFSKCHCNPIALKIFYVGPKWWTDLLKLPSPEPSLKTSNYFLKVLFVASTSLFPSLLSWAPPISLSLSHTPMHYVFFSLCIHVPIHPPLQRPIRWLERCLLRSSLWLHKRRDTESGLSVLEWRIVPGLPGGINRGISSSTAGPCYCWGLLAYEMCSMAVSWASPQWWMTYIPP